MNGADDGFSLGRRKTAHSSALPDIAVDGRAFVWVVDVSSVAPIVNGLVALAFGYRSHVRSSGSPLPSGRQIPALFARDLEERLDLLLGVGHDQSPAP